MARFILTAVLVGGLAVLPGTVRAGEALANDTFGGARPMSVEKAKALSLAWLKDYAKADAATLEKSNAIWSAKTDRSVLDRVADTLLLGSTDGRDLIAAARDPELPAPLGDVEVKFGDSLKALSFFSDDKAPVFFRANLGLHFAKHMCARKVYGEALATLMAFKAEDTVDPASYYFFRAVCENRLRFPKEGMASIKQLLADTTEAPERYVVVAQLMQLEMAQWKANDLGDIARRMKEVEDRLDNARHGKVTIDQEDEIVKMLAKLIEDLEKQQNQPPGPPGPPGDGPPNTKKSSSPAKDSRPGKGAGEGQIDEKDLVKELKNWGSLPEKERVKALRNIERKYSPEIADAIRGYLVKNGLLPAN